MLIISNCLETSSTSLKSFERLSRFFIMRSSNALNVFFWKNTFGNKQFFYGSYFFNCACKPKNLYRVISVVFFFNIVNSISKFYIEMSNGIKHEQSVFFSGRWN